MVEAPTIKAPPRLSPLPSRTHQQPVLPFLPLDEKRSLITKYFQSPFLRYPLASENSSPRKTSPQSASRFRNIFFGEGASPALYLRPSPPPPPPIYQETSARSRCFPPNSFPAASLSGWAARLEGKKSFFFSSSSISSRKTAGKEEKEGFGGEEKRCLRRRRRGDFKEEEERKGECSSPPPPFPKTHTRTTPASQNFRPKSFSKLSAPESLLFFWGGGEEIQVFFPRLRRQNPLPLSPLNQVFHLFSPLAFAARG